MERNIQSRIFKILKSSTLSEGDNAIRLGGK